MESIRRWVFSFRYTRRGQTNLWVQDGETRDEFTTGMPWQSPGVRLAEHNEKLEWIDVAVELTDDEDVGEARDTARDNADANFRHRHPTMDLAR